MTEPHRIPVVIGVADLRSGCAGEPAAPREPLDLGHEATTAALADTGVDVLAAGVDAIHAVRTASWSYDDLPGLLARRLGANPSVTSTTPLGGHRPAELLDRVAHGIATGAHGIATGTHDTATGTGGTVLIVGGEAQASVTGLHRSGQDPAELGWVAAPGGPPAFGPDDLGSAAMQRAGLTVPTRVYPLFENRFSHEIGLSREKSMRWSATMYAAFSELAAAAPAGWTRTARSADDILTVGPGNRLVTDPYPLTVNAMPFVDQAAAVVVTSLATARSLGVAEDRIVYVWGGAGTTEPVDVLARAELGRSPALADALHRMLTATGASAADFDVVDAYSCFPIVPKLLVEHLGLPRDTIPSVTGGHSFFGGPLNNYTLHSIVSATRSLRAGAGLALVHGNGGFLTYQHVVTLGSAPHPGGYVGDPVPVLLEATGPELATDYSGEVEIVTATAEYGRDGEPSVGLLVGATPDGRRVAGHTDATGARILAAGADLVGSVVHVDDRGGLLTVSAVREPAR